jgi:hypothetical protein
MFEKEQIGYLEPYTRDQFSSESTAHSLDSSEREKKAEQVKLLYFEEATGIEELNEHKDKADHVIVHFACVLCAGFLASFEADATAFRSMVDSMDSILNPGKQEGKSPQSP